MAEKKQAPTTIAIVPYAAENYALVKMGDTDKLTEIMQENLEGEDITAFDLPRVTLPAGDTLAWTLPSLDDDHGEIVKEFVGVIVHHKKGRAYWEKALDDGGPKGPPDCAATDGKNGVPAEDGDVRYGGRCASCPMSQFGSATKGKGQACKQTKQLFIVRADDMLPFCVILPPTSLKAAKQFLFKLSSRGLPFYGVETRFGLFSKPNPDGMDYAVATLSLSRIMTPEATATFRNVAKTLSPYLAAQPLSEADLSGGDQQPFEDPDLD